MSFTFNKSGCCKNPERETLVDTKLHKAVIYLACKKGLWVYGYQYSIAPKSGAEGSGGIGAGACFGKYRKKFKTRHQARTAAIMVGIDYLKDRDYKKKFQINQFREELKTKLNYQLTLFQ